MGRFLFTDKFKRSKETGDDEIMNDKKAKKLRKEIYGKDSIKERSYKIKPKTGEIIADGKRREYQRIKNELKY